MKQTVYVAYHCDCLGEKDGKPVERVLHMEERVEGSDIKEWMDKLTQKISDDHCLISPGCSKRTMKYVKIALPKDDPNAYIGKAANKLP